MHRGRKQGGIPVRTAKEERARRLRRLSAALQRQCVATGSSLGDVLQVRIAVRQRSSVGDVFQVVVGLLRQQAVRNAVGDICQVGVGGGDRRERVGEHGFGGHSDLLNLRLLHSFLLSSAILEPDLHLRLRQTQALREFRTFYTRKRNRQGRKNEQLER